MLGSSLFVAIGLLGHTLDGFRDKRQGMRPVFVIDAIAHISVPPDKWQDMRPVYAIEKRLDQDIWLLGDSHAAVLRHGLIMATSGEVKNLASRGCLPLRNVDTWDGSLEKGVCVEKTNAQLDKVIAEDPHAIVLLSSSLVYLEGTPTRGRSIQLITDRKITDRWQVYEMALRATLSELSVLQNATVIFVIDVPELGIDHGCDFGAKVLRTPWFEIGDRVGSFPVSKCLLPRQTHTLRTARYRQTVYSIVGEFPKVRIFDPTEHFCSELHCMGYSEDAGLLYRDWDHLSVSGSAYWAEHFADWLIQSGLQGQDAP